MQIKEMLKKFTDAVEQHKGAALGALFAENGVYHDAFYGAFKGRARVAELIDVWFYKTAHKFKWDMLEPVFDGRTLYVRYVFSYDSILRIEPRKAGQGVGKAVAIGVATGVGTFFGVMALLVAAMGD